MDAIEMQRVLYVVSPADGRAHRVMVHAVAMCYDCGVLGRGWTMRTAIRRLEHVQHRDLLVHRLSPVTLRISAR